VVVDDRSSDGTAEVARRPGVQVVPGASLPRGWVGKVWALEQGARGAASEYLLLTDADIRHGSCSLRRLVAEAEHDGLALVSRMARLCCSSRAERLLIPPFLFFFNLLYPMRRANRGLRPAAAGGCLLVRRGALERAGGFAAIRGAVIDDLDLARLVGGPLRLALSRSHVVSLRRHDRVRDVWGMVVRTAFSELDYSWARVAAATAGMVLLFAVPPVLTVGGSALAWWPVAGAGGAAWCVQAAVFLPTVRFFGLRPWRAAILPLAGVLYAAMAVDSARRRSGWTPSPTQDCPGGPGGVILD
jgi:hopene-associated glycosyltransferase HpnB